MSKTPRRDATRNANPAYVIDCVRLVLGLSPLSERKAGESIARSTVRDALISENIRRATKEAA